MRLLPMALLSAVPLNPVVDGPVYELFNRKRSDVFANLIEEEPFPPSLELPALPRGEVSELWAFVRRHVVVASGGCSYAGTWWYLAVLIPSIYSHSQPIRSVSNCHYVLSPPPAPLRHSPSLKLVLSCPSTLLSFSLPPASASSAAFLSAFSGSPLPPKPLNIFTFPNI